MGENAGTQLRPRPSFLSRPGSPSSPNAGRRWTQLQRRLNCNGRIRPEKNEFEKWNKEIKRREEAGGGGCAAGGGGWFGWAGRFSWSDDGNFWLEAQQTNLTVFGIVLLYLVIAKAERVLAVVLNPAIVCTTRNEKPVNRRDFKDHKGVVTNGQRFRSFWKRITFHVEGFLLRRKRTWFFYYIDYYVHQISRKQKVQ